MIFFTTVMLRLIVFFIILSFFYLIQTVNSFSQINIDVVYPEEGQKVVASDSTFIFGNVQPVDAQFSINAKDVKLFPNGAFITMLPIESGEFPFVCAAISGTDTATYIRNVYIPSFLKTSPASPLAVDTSYIFPKEDWELSADDLFRVALKGTPKCQVLFSITDVVSNLPMIELPPKKSFYWGEPAFGHRTPAVNPPVEGIYNGTFIVQPWHSARGSDITFTMINDKQDSIKHIAPGKLFIDNSNIPRIAKLIQDVTVANSRSRTGSQVYLPKDVNVQTSGRRGNYYKVQLAENDVFWLKNENLEQMPPGMDIENETISEIQIHNLPRITKIIIPFKDKIPYRIEQLVNPPALLVTFFRASARIDSLTYDYEESLVQDIQLKQNAENMCQLQFNLNLKHHWGYNPGFEENNFSLEIKRPPQIAHWPSSPLKDIIICLDPGHNPDMGAIGPSRLAEKDLNYEVCSLLKQKLQEKDAIIFLTRGKEDGISLAVRPKVAAFVGADILISVHFNSLPDGANPFSNRGVSDYYFHPQSYLLASLIHQELIKKTKLPHWGFFQNNLALCKPPQMIAVLTEPSFMIHPEDELLINTEKYKNKVAETIVEALEEFLKRSKN